MTNKQKFIEVMNTTFGAGLTPENMRPGRCSPCGVFKRGACIRYTCDGCGAWWDREYKPPEAAEEARK